MPKTSLVPICRNIAIRSAEVGVEILHIDSRDTLTGKIIVPWGRVAKPADTLNFINSEHEAGR